MEKNIAISPLQEYVRAKSYITRNLINTSDASQTVVPKCLELGSYTIITIFSVIEIIEKYARKQNKTKQNPTKQQFGLEIIKSTNTLSTQN